MLDMQTHERVRIEGKRIDAPFILVPTGQARSVHHVLHDAHVRFNLRSHDNTPDVMFELDPRADMNALQQRLDLEE